MPVWSQAVSIDAASDALAAGLQMPPGFVAQPLAQGLARMTQIEFTPGRDMLVSLQEGRIWRYTDQDGDGQYDIRRLYATGFPEVVGLPYDPLDGAVWVGGRGQLVRIWMATAQPASSRRASAACAGAATKTTAWSGTLTPTLSAARRAAIGSILVSARWTIWWWATMPLAWSTRSSTRPIESAHPPPR